jgi:phage-related protein
VENDKELVWIGSTKEDLSSFPDEVKLVMGFALRMAQKGGKHRRAKPLRGQGNAGILEIVDDFDGNTYRAVYTVRFPQVIYALHAFQKKSTRGKATSKIDLHMIERRLKVAAEDQDKRTKGNEGNGEGPDH